jgi:hypothetical protein
MKIELFRRNKALSAFIPALALAGLSACGSSDSSVDQNQAEVNAAAIATDAARMSADEMHNEMSQDDMRGQMDDQMMNEHHQMERNQMGGGNMAPGGGMKDDMGGMGGMGGNSMSNSQSMPKDKGDQPMPMKDDMGDM